MKTSKLRDESDRLEREANSAKEQMMRLQEQAAALRRGCTHLWDDGTSAIVTYDFHEACSICGGPG